MSNNHILELDNLIINTCSVPTFNSIMRISLALFHFGFSSVRCDGCYSVDGQLICIQYQRYTYTQKGQIIVHIQDEQDL